MTKDRSNKQSRNERHLEDKSEGQEQQDVVDEKMKQILKDDHTIDPYEIEFREEFRTGRGPEQPYVNEHGVVIGDHMYDSPDSPLNEWSTDTDPTIMSGDQWVHPYKDIGFHTEENRELFERGIPPQSGRFMHPDKDVAYDASRRADDDEPSRG